MELSPYLRAIQNVAGRTPGEKYEELNRIARTIITQFEGRSEFIHVQSSPELPEILIPLVKVEIARILRLPDWIVEALTSEDDLVFKRALRAKWFFNGTFESVTNAHYFRERIFNIVSLKSRGIIIKILPIHLSAKGKNTIAEEFYEVLLNMYDEQVAEPLLLACSEPFILNTITTRKLKPSCKLMRKLIDKLPNLLANFFPSSDSHQSTGQIIDHISLAHYDFLVSRIFKQHSNIFVNLVKTHGHWLVRKLNRKDMEKFLRISPNTVIDDAKRYVEFMDLKMITTNLCKNEFKIFFQHLFPTDIKEKYPPFSFMRMYRYLEFYPKHEALPLLLSTFEEVYKRNFTEFDDFIEPEFMVLLPTEQRVRIARKKLEKDPHPIKFDMETSWIIYFPIDESISTLKSHINKTHDFITGAEHRGKYLSGMISSCKINNDESALLSVLDYIITRHKNERPDILAEVMESLMREFRIENLPSQHWTILDTITNMLYVKDKTVSCQLVVQRLIVRKIHFSLVHNLPITEPITFYFKVSVEMFREWNILTDCLEYERNCLNELLNIGSTYSLCSLSRVSLINYIDSFMAAVLRFNERNQQAESPIEMMSIKNYSWLSSKIKELVSSDEEEVEQLKLNLKNCHPDLYSDWVKETKIEIEEERLIDLSKPKEWKKNLHKVLDHWKEYYNHCRGNTSSKYVHRFLKECRWYQLLPINFIEQSNKAVFEEQDVFSLTILALLLDGSSFEQAVAPFLPSNPSIDFESEDANTKYWITNSIPDVLSMLNPPASLELTAQYCKINFIQMAGNWLMTMSRQTPINKVVPFAINLLDKPVSISKHAIRICSRTASIEQLIEVLVNSWRNNKHKTIRCLTIDKMFHLFLKKPSTETWLMINECLDGLTVDDGEASRCLFNVREIPVEYAIAYTKKLLITLWRLQRIQADGPKVRSSFIDVSSFIRSLIDTTENFPEEFHEEIIRTYFADLTQPVDITTAAQEYLIRYITSAKDKLDLRSQFFSAIYLDILRTKWDVAHPQDSSKYMANNMTEWISEKMMWIGNAVTRNKFIDVMMKVFLGVLKPWQAPTFYLRCVFTSLYCDNISAREYTRKIVNIFPSIIATFSIAFIDEIGELLAECIRDLFKHDTTAVFHIIEHLIETNDEHIMILAFKILMHQNQSMHNEQYTKILNILRQQKYPSVLTHVYKKINSH